MPELLEFEEPVGVLLKEIEALSMLPKTPERERSIESLRRRADEIRGEIYATLTPWQRVLVARHPSRPNTLDYVERLFTNFDELHGDRRFADDHAIVAGIAEYKGQPIAVIGHQKGSDTKQKIFRNFGYARPEGYRKALRVMQFAEKFARPIMVFIDTPAAYPGMESEERGVAEAIAVNLREMMMIEVPIIVIVCGEGGSGGALGIAIGDRVLMQEFSVYSVIPPEGCAAILWRDANKKVEAAEALKITAADLLALGLIDAIIPEPSGGAHNDYDAATALVDQALAQALEEVAPLSAQARLDARYSKFRRMGEEGTAFIDTTALDGTDGSKTPSASPPGSKTSAAATSAGSPRAGGKVGSAGSSK
jgi:acetyl-CoA carboxylase carboxyl transferase subunit alpha